MNVAGAARHTGRPARVGGLDGVKRVLAHPLVVSSVVGLVAWWLLSGRVFEFLPTPYEVGVELADAVRSGDFYGALLITLRRVAFATVGAWMIAVVVGILMARSWMIETIAHPFVFVGLALPAPLAVLFTILAVGLGELTLLIALWLIVTPYIITFVFDGTKALDKRYQEMAVVYRFSTWERLRHVIAPGIAPALMSGARFGFIIGLKLVLVVEALAATTGVGEQIHFYFTFNQPARVIALSMTFTVVLALAELLVFRALDRRLFAHRRAASTEGKRLVQMPHAEA
jgi:NitT/TauT family transport system permease protein